MKRWTRIVVLLLLVALFISACAPAAQRLSGTESADAVMNEKSMARDGIAAPMPSMEAEMEAPAAEIGGSMAAYDALDERMIIRRTNMTVVVEDTDQMLAELQRIVSQYGGYISESNRWFVGEQPHARVTLRIPAENLADALGIMRDGAIRVESESSTGEDVTEEYFDLSARLRNLEATEVELLALLTEVRQSRSQAEDILAIHNRITEIRGQIESLKGRTQYLERMAALATVQVEIRPRQQPGTVVQPASWSPLVTLNAAARAFVEVLQVLFDLVVWLLIFSPFVLVPVFFLWLIIRLIRRRRRPESSQA